AASAGAEAVARLLAEPAPAARRDARDEHAVADGEGADAAPGLDDGPDGLVAENRARPHLGDVALEDVEVGPADRRGVDADDRVRRLPDRRVGRLLPGLLARAVVDERLHVATSSSSRSRASGAEPAAGTASTGQGAMWSSR